MRSSTTTWKQPWTSKLLFIISISLSLSLHLTIFLSYTDRHINNNITTVKVLIHVPFFLHIQLFCNFHHYLKKQIFLYANHVQHDVLGIHTHTHFLISSIIEIGESSRFSLRIDLHCPLWREWHYSLAGNVTWHIIVRYIATLRVFLLSLDLN